LQETVFTFEAFRPRDKMVFAAETFPIKDVLPRS